MSSAVDADDDFFGLRTIEASPMPTSFRQLNDIKADDINYEGDLFETQFFAEVVAKEGRTHASRKQTPGRDVQEHGEGGSFFSEHFFKKGVQMPSMELASTREENSPFIEMDAALSRNGLKEIWGRVDPVWKFSETELVDFMAKRVIYETEHLIALDKPFQMAYASAPRDQAQLDRILQLLKKRIAPDIDRLNLIFSLDKQCGGVILFAKSREKQLEYSEMLNQDHFLFRFRCLCKNVPKEKKYRVNIPLIKVVKASNFKLCPLIGETKKPNLLYHLNTDCRLLDYNRQARISLVDAFSRRGMANVVRSHLYYGLNCPVVGDKKYAKGHLPHERPLTIPWRISPSAMSRLELSKNHLRQMPLFMHLEQVLIPEGQAGNHSSVRSELPRYFTYALRKLALSTLRKL